MHLSTFLVRRLLLLELAGDVVDSLFHLILERAVAGLHRRAPGQAPHIPRQVGGRDAEHLCTGGQQVVYPLNEHCVFLTENSLSDFADIKITRRYLLIPPHY